MNDRIESYNTIYGILISEYDRGVFLSPYQDELSFGKAENIGNIKGVWTMKEDMERGEIWVYKGGDKEHQECLYALLSNKEIEVYNKNGRAWITDINPYIEIVVGPLATFANLKGEQMIPFEYWKRENILHISNVVYVISKSSGEVLLHVQDKRWNNKIIKFNINKGRIEEEILDYNVNHGGIKGTRLLGYEEESKPIFISTVYWEHLALNEYKIKGTEVDRKEKKWNRVELLYNDFPNRCVVVASGYNIAPVIYEINIREKRGEKVGEINIDGKYFWSVEPIRSKDLYEKLKELSE